MYTRQAGANPAAAEPAELRVRVEFRDIYIRMLPDECRSVLSDPVLLPLCLGVGLLPLGPLALLFADDLFGVLFLFQILHGAPALRSGLFEPRRARDGKVRATVARARLEDVNDVFAKMHKGQIEGRIVIDMTA